VPLAAGLYWKRANTTGAVLSVVFGLFSWGVAEMFASSAAVPPQFVGLAFSALGMVLGAAVPRERTLPQAHSHGGQR
jgi:SSS family solute:Na+ symporter